MFIPDPASDIFHPVSQIQSWQDPGSRSGIKEFNILKIKIRDVHPGIRGQKNRILRFEDRSLITAHESL